MVRPMADLFAVADREPEALDRIEERLANAGDFAVVWRPTPGWVAAWAPLPESSPEREEVRAGGFAFIEGRDRLEHPSDPGWLERVRELADRSPHRLHELPGDFGFIRFRPDGSALAVRSCGGWVPLYLHRGERGRLAIGTRLNYFPRLLPTRFLPDPLVNASWDRTPLRFIDGRTFVAGVTILPRGSYTEVGADRAPQTDRYWDPRPEVGDEPEPSPEHPRQLREILIETLSRDLDAKDRNLLLLSGGVDSSSLAALAAGTLGYHLSSWSLIPPADPEQARDLSYIDPVVSQFGIDPAYRREHTEEADRRWTLNSPALPFQVLHPALCDLSNICTEHEIRVLLSGMFADEVCGHVQVLNDWVRHTSFWSLVGGAPLPFGRRNYVGWARRRMRDAIGRPQLPTMDLPQWVSQDVQDEYADWIKRHQSALARDRRPLRELAARASADAWVAAYWEGTARLGVRPLLPFFNREVLELAFRCHPSELLGPGPKRLLREALRDDVPARNLMRPDRGFWNGHHTDGNWRMDGPLPDIAAQVMRSDWLPGPPVELPFIDGSLLVYAIRVAEYLNELSPVERN